VVDDYHPGHRALIHGATVHGMQATDPALPLTPITYFAREGPIGDVFAAMEQRLQNAHVAVVGLGAGELASYATPGQSWTFFEIDSVVETIARERFTYLPRAGAQTRVVLGDGRLELSRTPALFDLIILDAFSSDAIPVHLVTVEAFAAYRQRLRAGGVIAVNVSNRFVDLEKPLARLADASGLVGLIRFDTPPPPTHQAPSRFASAWVVLSEDAEALATLASNHEWRTLRSDGGRAWTDERADLLRAIRWRAVGALSVR
jgi:spermidine synthase